MSRFTNRLLCIYVVLIILFSATMPILATENDHTATLDDLHFDITLCEDGSAEITEIRNVSFDGDYEFTRYGVNNHFTGPRVFSDWKVMMDGEELSMLDSPDNDSRPENTFAVENKDGENTVFIYHRSTYTTRTFAISYRVENAVKLYSDVGEFFWNLTGENGISDIGKITAELTIPEGVSEADFRLWAHGPLNGTFEKQDTSSAYLNVENVSRGEIIDIRSTIPAELFTGGWVNEGEALPGILEEEKVLSDSANAKREEEARRQAEIDAYWEARYAWEAEHPFLAWLERFCSGIYYSVYYALEGVFLIFTVFAFILAYILTNMIYKRLPAIKKFRHTPEQSPQYYRELPDKRPAPIVDRLVHFYKGDGNADTSRQISAALLEMNLKKLIQFQINGEKAKLVLNEKFGWTMFGENKAEPSYREILWRFINTAAQDKGGYIGINELKQYVKENQETAYNFRNDFISAVDRDYEKWVKNDVLPKKRLKKSIFVIPIIGGIIAALITLFSSIYDGFNYGLSLISGISIFILLILISLAIYISKNGVIKNTKVLEQKSENDKALWQAFGQFLEDFTTFDKKELPEFPVWREYMVYAVAMGKGKKVAKTLAVKYPEVFQSETGTDLFEDDFYRVLENVALYDAFEAIGKEVATAAPPKSDFSSDHDFDNWSDGDGGGGGFSDFGGGSDSGSGGDFAD